MLDAFVDFAAGMVALIWCCIVAVIGGIIGAVVLAGLAILGFIVLLYSLVEDICRDIGRAFRRVFARRSA